MFDTLAHLISDVHLALGSPDSIYLEPEDIARGALKTLAYYGLDAAQSQYARQGRHVTFVPTSRDTRITQASDIAIASYVERRIGPAPNDRWELVNLTYPALLGESAGRGDARAALELQHDGFHLLLNYDATGVQHRLSYYTSPATPSTKEDVLNVPQRFGFLMAAETILAVIPTMMMRSAELPEDKRLNEAQIIALKSVASMAKDDVKQWTALWKTEKDAGTEPVGRNRRRILGNVQL